MKVRALGRIRDEFVMIKRLSGLFHTRREETLVSLGDDAAIYRPAPNQGQVVTVDMMVEGVHFTRKTMSCRQIGHKAIASNLSDIAAMGGKPTYFVTALAISPDWSEQDVMEIYRGMEMVAGRYQVELLGGDTVSASSQLVLTVTAIGEVENGVTLLRSKAQPDQVVFVTGPLGSAAAGLDLLLRRKELTKVDLSAWQPLIEAHQQPWPHVEQGRLLAQLARGHHLALNDISDGLSSEANEIAAASGVDLVLVKEKLPMSEALLTYARWRGVDPYRWVLEGGEDYVLVGTASPHLLEEMQKRFTQRGLDLFAIGYTTSGRGQAWLEINGERQLLSPQGYNHFKQKRES